MKCKKPQPGCCAAQAGASSGTLDVVQRGGPDGGSNSERCDLVPSERRRPPQGWPSTRYRASTRLSLIAPIRVVVVADPNPPPAAPVSRDYPPAGIIIWASEADADAKEEGVIPMPKVVPRPLPVGSSPGRAPPVRPAPSAAGPPLPVGSPQGRPPRIRPTPSASSSYARASTHRGCRLQLAPLWVRLDARRHCRNHGFPSCRRRSRRRVHAGVRREVCGTGRRCKVGRVRKGRVLEPRRLCQESRACNNPRCHRTQQQCRPLVRRCSHEIARGTRAEEVSRYSGSISPLPHWQGFFLCIYLHKQLVANSRDFAHQEKRFSGNVVARVIENVTRESLEAFVHEAVSTRGSACEGPPR